MRAMCTMMIWRSGWAQAPLQNRRDRATRSAQARPLHFRMDTGQPPFGLQMGWKSLVCPSCFRVYPEDCCWPFS